MLDKKDKYEHRIYKGVCQECGYETYSSYGKFSRRDNAKICKHLDASGRYVKPTQCINKRIMKILSGMKGRCYNKRDKNYKSYGAKGIHICDEWLDNPKSFEDWSLQNGYADNLTIDRIDSSKDYCPENCRWILLGDNSKYKSTTSLIEVNGEVHTGRDWADILGLGTNIINKYVRKYGLENTIEFIRRYIKNPKMKPGYKQSYYDLYMNT